MITLPRPSSSPSSPPPPDDERASALRARGFALVIAVLFMALVARLWFMQVAHGDEYRALSDANQARHIRSRPARGIILDRTGALLAADRSRFAVYATPDILKNTPVLGRLALLLHITPDDVRQTVQESRLHPDDPQRVLGDVSMTTVTQIEENKPFLPGVSTAPEPVRWYPHKGLAAQLLGTLGRVNDSDWRRLKAQGRTADYFADDFVGKTGLERQYETYLHGTPGGTDVQIDARGRRVRTLSTASAIPGGTITLTIDARVQAAAEAALRARHFVGAAVAIDPRTGAVLALASAPTYDPDLFATGITTQNWTPLSTDPNHPLLDRAVDALYPPGSTFKPIIAAAGLQTGAITTHTTVYCPGSFHLGRARFGCWAVHGTTDFYKAIADSCDVFFYQAGLKIGPDAMSDYAKSFGLAQKTGIDLPSESLGSIPSPAWKAKHFAKAGPGLSTWFGGDTLHMSIGQGDVLTTPLQMARVAATLANGGDVLRPYVVQKIVGGHNGQVVFSQNRALLSHIPVSPTNLEYVRRGMRDTVVHGTGKVVSFPNYPQITVAAKTGSAQTHGTAKTHGWFICFAPYNHPTIAIAAVVEHGGHGGDTAGKVSRAMLQAYFHIPITDSGGAKSD